MSLTTIPEQVFHSTRPRLSPGISMVIAVSGGSDSVALLFLLKELQNRLEINRLVVAHVNHGLRGEASDEDERLVRRHAETLRVPFHVRHLSGHSINEPGLEAWAREERYRFFNEIRQAEGCDLIATGHTLDDQAETVLMRMVRGTGLNGLRGVLPLRDDGVLRPLLRVRKGALEAWLAAKNISYRIDQSNADERLLRNRIRHSVLPLLESEQSGAVEHLAAIAADANRRWMEQREKVSLWLRKALFAATATSFRLRSEGFSDREIASEAVRQVLAERGITPTRTHIDEIISCGDRTGGMFLLPGGWSYRCGRGVLYFSQSVGKSMVRCPVPGEVAATEEGRVIQVNRIDAVPDQLNRGKWTVLIDGAGVGNEVVYRTVTPEDTFIPFGTSRVVNVMKFLAKQGIPLPLRERTGILVTVDNKPLWIHGIRLDERCRVTAATKSWIIVQSRSIL